MRLVLDEHHVDAGEALAIRLEHAGGEGLRRARERADPQSPAAQARERVELGEGLLRLGEDPLGAQVQQLARRGELHAAGRPLHEEDPDLGLEPRHLLGDGGRREASASAAAAKEPVRTASKTRRRARFSTTPAPGRVGAVAGDRRGPGGPPLDPRSGDGDGASGDAAGEMRDASRRQIDRSHGAVIDAPATASRSSG